MWSISGDEYPILVGVTDTYEFYDNYYLPYSFKYKIEEDVNDGYPYIYRFQSGWGVAYAFEKDSAWSSATVWTKSDGEWQQCAVLVYGAITALYTKPNITTGWKISSGKNDGYPYIVYGEIPYYEEE